MLFKKGLINDFLVGNNIEISGYIIKTQIKCIQNINVLKYKPNARSNNNTRLPYFNHQKGVKETTEDDNEVTILAKELNVNIEKDYVNILYFIDENAEVQVVHTQ